jgi:hypothetical protein
MEDSPVFAKPREIEGNGKTGENLKEHFTFEDMQLCDDFNAESHIPAVTKAEYDQIGDEEYDDLAGRDESMALEDIDGCEEKDNNRKIDIIQNTPDNNKIDTSYAAVDSEASIQNQLSVNVDYQENRKQRNCCEAIINILGGMEPKITPSTSPVRKSEIAWGKNDEVDMCLQQVDVDDRNDDVIIETVPSLREDKDGDEDQTDEGESCMRTEETEYGDMLVAMAEVLEMASHSGKDDDLIQGNVPSALSPIGEDIDEDGDADSVWGMSDDESPDEPLEPVEDFYEDDRDDVGEDVVATKNYSDNPSSVRPLAAFMTHVPEKYIEDADDPLLGMTKRFDINLSDQHMEIVDNGESDDWSQDSWGEQDMDDDVNEDAEYESTPIIEGNERITSAFDMTVFGVPFPANSKQREAMGIHIDSSDTPASRIEALREFLENRIGEEKFIRTYRLLRSSTAGDGDESDDDKLLLEVESIVGADGLEYIEMFYQLITMEESFDS